VNTLIDFVEKELGPILTWPTEILCYLLVDVQNPRRVEELSAFFFGNGLPYRLAWRLYKACNPTVTRATLEEMFDFYSSWGKWWYTPHVLEYYYNTRFEKFVFNNGAILYRMELVKPKETIMDFGFEPTGCETLMKFVGKGALDRSVKNMYAILF
jgi:hypothetical protein